MEWRCTWCGKPHPADDPPCDNCGHGRFERTVVPVSDADGPEQIEWVCTECSRGHPRNSPPCSRCGNTSFEARQPDYSDLEEIGPGSYLDLASPRFLALGAVVVLLGAVLVLGAVGVVDLPSVGPGHPTVSDVPGNGTVAGDLSLDAVETALVADLNDRRAATGLDALRRDETLSGVATYLNRRYVKAVYADAERPDAGAAFDGFGASCPRQPVVTLYTTRTESASVTVSSFDSETDLAETLAATLARRDIPAAEDRRAVGVDVHVAPDGVVYVTRIDC